MKIYEKELFVNDESVVIDVGGSCGFYRLCFEQRCNSSILF